MKEIVIISGKGGTGKTVVSAAFAALAKNKVIADCDVDAANLHLLLHPEIREEYQFSSGTTAFINQGKCVQCGKCQDICRFNAINTNFTVDPISCEGCVFCSRICPVNAIEMQPNISGTWYISKTKYGNLIHAELGVAEENSGKLVSLIRQKARNLAVWQNSDWLIIDGPPGVGCATIATSIGANLAVIVAEPTLSGIHDLQRAIALSKKLNIAAKVIINKYDINLENSQKILAICQQQLTNCIGKIPYAKEVFMAVSNRKIITEEFQEHQVTLALQQIWQQIKIVMTEN